MISINCNTFFLSDLRQKGGWRECFECWYLLANFEAVEFFIVDLFSKLDFLTRKTSNFEWCVEELEKSPKKMELLFAIFFHATQEFSAELENSKFPKTYAKLLHSPMDWTMRCFRTHVLFVLDLSTGCESKTIFVSAYNYGCQRWVANRYKVEDATNGKDLLNLRENSNCCMRRCCGSNAPFVISTLSSWNCSFTLRKWSFTIRAKISWGWSNFSTE